MERESRGAVGDGVVALEISEVVELVSVLDELDDWLLHAQPDALEDMVEFLSPARLGRAAKEGIVEVLDFYAAELNRRLRSAQTQVGTDTGRQLSGSRAGTADQTPGVANPRGRGRARGPCRSAMPIAHRGRRAAHRDWRVRTAVHDVTGQMMGSL